MQLAVAPELKGWQLREEARSRGEPCAKAELFEETELLREVGREEGREGGRKWEGWRRRDGGREGEREKGERKGRNKMKAIHTQARRMTDGPRDP